MKRKPTLTTKSVLLFIVMAILLILFTCVVFAVQHFLTEREGYRKQAFIVAKTCATYIDGDSISRYYHTKQKDEYYDTISKYLKKVQEECELKYAYVFIPLEDTMFYIWDNEGDLGYEEPYTDEASKMNTADAFSETAMEDIIISNDNRYSHVASAYYPIYDAKGVPAALVGVDLPMESFYGNLGDSLLIVIINITVIISIFLTFFYALIQNSILDPIRHISQAASRMVRCLQHDEKVTIEVHTHDEIEDLADSFLSMNDELQTYIRDLAAITAEKQRISAELNVAAKIQADMLPRIFPPFPNRKEFDLYASMNPAKEVGGDFYDYFLIDDDHLALVIADVSGKGVPAALFMVIAKSLIKNHAKLGEYSPAKVLMQANEQLCEGNEAELFVTVWLAILQISTGKGVAANAGHEHPALCHRDGSFELVKYRHSPAVATMEGMRFREHEFALLPGDKVFVYTDGVTEATDAQNELFGEERLLDALNVQKNANPRELLEHVKTAVDTFVGDAPQFDDLTMVCFSYYGTPQTDSAQET